MSSSDRFLLPIVPQIHGISCSTFKMPPLGGSLTLPELYEWHVEHCPEHPLFVFAQEDGSIRKLCWPEVLRAVYTGVKIIRDRTHWQAGMTKAPVVAILSSSDSVPYATTTMAIMRANCTAFLISSRNSPAAVAHLLYKTACGWILGVPPPRSPVVVSTPENVLEMAKATSSDLILTVPSMVEAWSRNPDHVKFLAAKEGILFGGSPLNQEIGDYLTAQGITLFSLYGAFPSFLSTESGVMAPLLPGTFTHTVGQCAFRDALPSGS
ncbi:hypothetical protein IEO21_07451 [Rhodonia placenta]|uniref:AMP-dependent synthetase/ligase domain-containing protein n=1 Tax=Rhodonia placenta TaxID=104341 RepID=A0A8H7U0B4_9APHY|nr:hypothetical protein IEO21_07451 [Postia placenta]